MNLHEIGEFGLIARWGRQLVQRVGVRLGIGDDAAVLEPLKSPVVTCDGLVENIHFRLDWTTPRLLGRKAIAVNVSDIAAMGGQPIAAFITVAATPALDAHFFDEFYAGLEEAAALYGLTIAGGDTVKSPSALMLSVTVIGNAPAPILRSGAQVGDVVLVTGTLGDAAAGLALLQAPETPVDAAVREYIIQRHHDPTARLAEIKAAMTADPSAITAGLDLSDGLAGDAAHIAEQSNLTLELDIAQLPISAACREAARVIGSDVLDWALRGGEDYELLFCVAPKAAHTVASAITHQTGTSTTIIGRCVPRSEDSVILVGPDEKRERAGSAFSHF